MVALTRAEGCTGVSPATVPMFSDRTSPSAAAETDRTLATAWPMSLTCNATDARRARDSWAASSAAWLTVVPVVEDDGRPHGAETGTVGEVVARYGAWADREITVSGSPPMVRATTNALLDAGTPFRNIHYDPYHTD